MITGIVTPNRQAMIRLVVRGSMGQELHIDIVGDTGFVGMALLDGYELDVQVRNGGSVTIKELAGP